jgi:hypothetical protein
MSSSCQIIEMIGYLPLFVKLLTMFIIIIIWFFFLDFRQNTNHPMIPITLT